MPSGLLPTVIQREDGLTSLVRVTVPQKQDRCPIFSTLRSLQGREHNGGGGGTAGGCEADRRAG